MTSTVMVVVAGAALGPLTVLLCGRASRQPWSPSLVEIMSIASVAGIIVAIVLDGPRIAAVLLPLALLGPAAAVVDVREGRLPDAITGPLLGGTLIIALLTSSDGARLIAVAVAAAIAATLLAVLARDLVGWGDAKLIPTLAVVLVDRGVLLDGLVYATAMIALTAIGVAIAERRSLVPYGPALIVGALAAAV